MTSRLANIERAILTSLVVFVRSFTLPDALECIRFIFLIWYSKGIRCFNYFESLDLWFDVWWTNSFSAWTKKSGTLENYVQTSSCWGPDHPAAWDSSSNDFQGKYWWSEEHSITVLNHWPVLAVHNYNFQNLVVTLSAVTSYHLFIHHPGTVADSDLADLWVAAPTFSRWSWELLNSRRVTSWYRWHGDPEIQPRTSQST